MERELRDKLNDMFDISSAVVTKRQGCPLGRWLYTPLATLLSSALFGFLVWESLRFLDNERLYFVLAILVGVYAFVLFRIWLAFAADVVASKFSEEIRLVREGENRYYYTRGNYVEKFEYDGGKLVLHGDAYDKFEDKSQYSRLALRTSKSLRRRCSAYGTLTPAFWYDLLHEGAVTVTERGVTAVLPHARVSLDCGEDGKICHIEYRGDGALLYDSPSPLPALDVKYPAPYRIRYDFAPREDKKIELRALFRTAMQDYLMPIPVSVAEFYEQKHKGKRD